MKHIHHTPKTSKIFEYDEYKEDEVIIEDDDRDPSEYTAEELEAISISK